MSILPIDINLLEEDKPEITITPKESKEKLPSISEESEEESVNEHKIDLKESEVFEKPVEISKRTGKPKRKLTQLQLENLKKAREKSKLKRTELAEIRQMDIEIARQKKMNSRIAKAEKMADQSEIISYKAKLALEAEQNSHWTEDRLQLLIDKSIDNYIDKKKKSKPIPKVHIPANQTINYSHPNHPSQQYMQQQYVPPSAPIPIPQKYDYSHIKPQKKYSVNDSNAINSLFGNFGD